MDADLLLPTTGPVEISEFLNEVEDGNNPRAPFQPEATGACPYDTEEDHPFSASESEEEEEIPSTRAEVIAAFGVLQKALVQYPVSTERVDSLANLLQEFLNLSQPTEVQKKISHFFYK